MNSHKAGAFRAAIAGFPYTGGGLFVPVVLRRYDERFMPWGNTLPTFDDMMSLLEGVAEATKREIRNIQCHCERP